MEAHLVSFCINKKGNKAPVATNRGLWQNNFSTGALYPAQWNGKVVSTI